MSGESLTHEDLLAQAAPVTAEQAGEIQRYLVAPALLEMMGPAQGKEVLELYCGAGYFSRRLAALGAKVTAIDPSERLIGIAKEIEKREDSAITYAVAEPIDLSVIDESSFDDIVCNMGLMMARDINGIVAELARLVRLGGRFIFSVLHPCFCPPDSCWSGGDDGRPRYRSIDNYFAEGWYVTDLINHSRTTGGHKVKHRSVSHYVNALGSRGFTVRRVLEPRPGPDILTLRPHLEVYSRIPPIMVFEAIFPYL